MLRLIFGGIIGIGTGFGIGHSLENMEETYLPALQGCEIIASSLNRQLEQYVYDVTRCEEILNSSTYISP
jgi:hypothetical protein